MELRPVVAVGDVNPRAPGDWVRVNDLRRRDAVLPLLLHLGVHDEQRVVRQVDGDLAPGVSVGVADGLTALGVPREDAPHAELAGHAEGQGPDDGPWSEVCQLVAVPADALLRPSVAVQEGCVGPPPERRLVLELLAAWVARLHPPLDFTVHGLFHFCFDVLQLGGELAHVLGSDIC